MNTLKRALYILNIALALLFAGTFGAVLLAPQMVEQQVGERLENVLVERATERYPVLRSAPDLRQIVRGVGENKWLQALRAGPVGQRAAGQYAGLIQELEQDVRIFAATNLTLFALAAIAIARERAQRTAIMLSLILTASALAGTWCYVFGQNWLDTVLFSHYFGYGYSALAVAIAAALSDIAFNEARVLMALIESLHHFHPH